MPRFVSIIRFHTFVNVLPGPPGIFDGLNKMETFILSVTTESDFPGEQVSPRGQHSAPALPFPGGGRRRRTPPETAFHWNRFLFPAASCRPDNLIDGIQRQIHQPLFFFENGSCVQHTITKNTTNFCSMTALFTGNFCFALHFLQRINVFPLSWAHPPPARILSNLFLFLLPMPGACDIVYYHNECGF